MKEFDLVIVGSGSGNSIPESLADHNIALVERDVFGGTCLNRGCIPSKMFIYAADVALAVKQAAKYQVDASFGGADWPAIRDRVFGRIDPIAAGGERYRVEDCDNITVFAGSGTFVEPKVLEVNGERLTAPQFILGAGARPFVPHIPGLADSGFHTSDTIMRIDELPEHLIVLGGGYIATELGHVFDGLGSSVTMLNRGPRLLRSEDTAISERYTELAAERFDLRTNLRFDKVERTSAGVAVTITRDDDTEVIEGDTLLVATGRIPNGDQLGVEAGGIAVDAAGRVIVDEHLRTNVEGVYAFGDLATKYQLKHVANAEAKVAFHNVAHPDDLRSMDWSIVPHAVFGSPQVASVGMTERDAAEEGVPYCVSVQDYASVAYGWAMEDTTSFVKLIAHSHTRRLLGAHIIGPQASTLIQLLIQGMRFGQTIDEMAREQMWIHPALTEVIENALLNFPE